MRKILNYLLVIALVFAQSALVVNAATINIGNTVSGQTYNAYKIFDVTNAGEGYAYSINSSNEWYGDVVEYVAKEGTITLTRVGTTDKYVVQTKDLDAKDFAEFLNTKKNGKTATASKKAVSETTVIDGLEAGYYFVDSSLGALCILHTATDKVDVKEKNAPPTIDKEADKTTASVGEVVNFTIKLTAGGKADTSYIVHDKMSDGLDLNQDSIKVQLDGTTDVASENYSIIYNPEDGDTFDITFKEAYTAGLEKDTVIVITYSAVINENAIVASEVTNEAKVQYGDSNSTTDKVTVKNYDFELVKYTESDASGEVQLEGAKFKLYNAKTGGEEIKLVKEADGTYRPAKDGETAVEYIEAGKVRINGLSNGTYYLEEIEAPEGYNQLTERYEITINDSDLLGNSAVKVLNTTGAMLPSTGGMGTVLFMVIGSIMVLGFGVLLVTKLRVSKMTI